MTNRKILHAADIHLDSPLQRLGSYDDAPIEQIRGASRRALENMVNLAVDQQVDLVVIAGDLYDGDYRDQNTGLFFVRQATRLVNAGIPVVVIRGNHDAMNVMTSTLPLPANPDGSKIMMSEKRVDQRVFDDRGIVVHGRSFRKRAETDDLSKSYPAPLSGMFNLGLLHTSLTGAEGHEPYAPCSPVQLSDKRYDYWALGHVHTRAEYVLDDAAPIVFSGNIQGRHIREFGPKGCVIVDIDSHDQTTRQFHPLDVVRWIVCEIDVSAMTHVDEIHDAFQQWILATLPDLNGRLLVVRVRLTGRSTLHGELHRQVDQLEASLRATAMACGDEQTWLEKLRLKTSPPADNRVTADVDGPLASLQTIVDQFRSDPSLGNRVAEELSALISKVPAECRDPDDDPDNPQWSSELLESASAQLRSHLQGQQTQE
tara:strand:+ start:77925 stop:79208 length:1284 start_codon:yes stop_codon:yes gene_type:complete